MSASVQGVPVDQLTGEERLYLKVFHSVDNEPKKVLSRHFMNQAMNVIYGWTKCQAEDVCRSLTEKGRLFEHPKARVSHRPPVVRNSRRGRCVYCGKWAKRITIDHVIPRSKGGTDHPRNLVECCESCNLSKANRDPIEWARDILDYRKPVKPMRHRTTLFLRLRLAVCASLAFVGGLLR